MSRDDFLVKFSKDKGEPDWLLNYRKKALSESSRLAFEPDSKFSKYNDRERYLTLSESELEIAYTKPEENRTSSIHSNASGILVEEISSALKNDKRLRDAVEHEVNYDSVGAAINSSFSSGLFIRVPDSYSAQVPLQISTSVFMGLNINKSAIIVGKNSHVKIVCELVSADASPSKFMQNLSVRIGQDSSLQLYSIQATNPYTIVSVWRDVYSEGKFGFVSLDSGGNSIRSRLKLDLEHGGAEGDVYEAFVGRSDMYFDVFNKIDHTKGNTISRTNSRAILDDSSKAVFKGSVHQEKEAIASHTTLSEHSLLLSSGARSVSIPGLEIETNEVSASHSASSHTISKEDKFYLMSRGIEEKGAANMIAVGFLDPVLSKFYSGLSDYYGNIEERLKNIVI